MPSRSGCQLLCRVTSAKLTKFHNFHIIVCCCCARLILLVPKIVVFTLNPSCSEDTSRSQEFNSSVVNCLGEWVPTAMPSAEILPQRIDCWLWHKIGLLPSYFRKTYRVGTYIINWNRLNNQPTQQTTRWHGTVALHGSFPWFGTRFPWSVLVGCWLFCCFVVCACTPVARSTHVTAVVRKRFRSETLSSMPSLQIPANPFPWLVVAWNKTGGRLSTQDDNKRLATLQGSKERSFGLRRSWSLDLRHLVGCGRLKSGWLHCPDQWKGVHWKAIHSR